MNKRDTPTPTFDDTHTKVWLWQCWNCSCRRRTYDERKPPIQLCTTGEPGWLDPCQWFSKGIDHIPNKRGTQHGTHGNA